MSQMTTYSRRRFLQALGVGAAALPLASAPGFLRAAGGVPATGNILILVELAGGNDGLNTVIPLDDPRYRYLRKEIGISKRDAIGLGQGTGLHPEMRGMARLWEQGEMQIVQGVGYPDPNRSHFRSIEIWNAGMGADSLARDGWVSSAFVNDGPGYEDADGLALGGEMGPLAGPGRFSALREEDMFLETIENLQAAGPHAVRPKGARSPLDHVLATYDSALITGEKIQAKLEGSRPRRWGFPETGLGQQLRTAARLLDAGVEVPVLKVVQDGYDTHDAQPDVHSYLLMELSEALDAFAAAMRDAGLWDRVTVVTYSEFGRTARENASAGTDHGTAAPVFVTGGAVAGGFAGQRVALDRLQDDDLVHTTDYRALYAGLLRDLWRIDAPEFADDRPPIRIF